MCSSCPEEGVVASVLVSHNRHLCFADQSMVDVCRAGYRFYGK
jgi:hypothetical protein